MIIETEAAKAQSDLSINLIKQKETAQAEKDKLAKQVQDLHQFEQDEADLDRKAAELAERLREETGMAEAKRKEQELEVADYEEAMHSKIVEGQEIEGERRKLEQERRAGTYELEKNKIENQKTIDYTRKLTQKLHDTNKGSLSLLIIRISYAGIGVARHIV